MRRSRLFVRDEKVARHIDSERRSAPRERHATTTVAIVVNEELAAETLRIDNKAARAIRPQSHDFANDSIPGYLDRCEGALRIQRKRGARRDQRSARHGGAAQEITSIDSCIHGFKFRVQALACSCRSSNLKVEL